MKLGNLRSIAADILTGYTLIGLYLYYEAGLFCRSAGLIYAIESVVIGSQFPDLVPELADFDSCDSWNLTHVFSIMAALLRGMLNIFIIPPHNSQHNCGRIGGYRWDSQFN